MSTVSPGAGAGDTVAAKNCAAPLSGHATRNPPGGGNMKQTPTLAPAAEALTQTPSPTSLTDFHPVIAMPCRRSRRATTAGLSSRPKLLLTAIFLHAVVAVTFWGQEFRGTIIGSVSDPTGAVIANAVVTAKGPQQTYTTKTNGSGNFIIPFVQPGSYEVTAEAQGFKKELTLGVNIDVSQKVNLNFKLQVGATSEEVTVSAEAVGVNTADASGGTVMDPEKVQNLPLNGRQVYMLLALTPGTRFTTTSFGPSGNSFTRGWHQTPSYEINPVPTLFRLPPLIQGRA